MDDIDPYTLINEQSKKWNAHGVSLVKSSKLDEALKSFEKAIDCDSSNFKAYKNMSIVYTKLNKNNDAAYYLNKSKDALKKLEKSNNSSSSSFVDNNVQKLQPSGINDKTQDSNSLNIMGYVESITGGSKTKTVCIGCIGLFIFFAIIGAILPHNSSSDTVSSQSPVSVQTTISTPIPTQSPVSVQATISTPIPSRTYAQTSTYTVQNNPPTIDKKGNVINGFEVVDSQVYNEGYGLRYIRGSIVNHNRKTYSYVQVDFNLYDPSGAQVGSTFANINNLEPGGVWKFEAIVMEDRATSYKLKDISAF